MNRYLPLCVRILLALPALMTLGNSRAAAQVWSDTLDMQLDEISCHSRLPGWSVAIVNPDEILYQRSMGWANLEKQVPFDPHTLLNVGSVSKTLIGVALMQLAEEGEINLDSSINAYLPFAVHHPSYPGQTITLRHLATHTSGISDGKYYNQLCYVLLDGYPEDDSHLSKSQRRYFRQLQKNPLQPLDVFLENYLTVGGNHYHSKNFNQFAPGTHYEYTNIGATLAALVIEQVSGEPFDVYTRRHILEPLEMRESGWKYSEVKQENLAKIYFPGGIPVPRYTLVTYPDGGLISNAHDLIRYLMNCLKGYVGEGGLLKPDSWQEMMVLQFEGEEEKTGLFWSISKSGRIGHTGADPGIFTWLQIDPETQTGYLMLTNTSAFEDPETMEEVKSIWKTLIHYGKEL
ncbi:MAG: beta-lactamase family protein [Bacteroidia bacterium]|nr:beta-lactamase family protein [Bacteroidia bacterium]